MTTIDDFEQRARALQQHRQHLATLARELQAGLDALKADTLPELRASIDAASAAWSALEQLVRDNPAMFVKPRTLTLHGIRFGLAKGAGRLELDDEARTVALIRKHLPEQADVLIATKEGVVKDALMQLAAAELAKVGARISGTGDQVVIRPADGDIDRLVKALVQAEVEGETR